MHSHLTLKAYGKINPILEITGKKPDGFYALDIFWHRIALFDEITITLTENPGTIDITSDHPQVPQKEYADQNNCYKAVKALEAFKLPGIHIHIQKNLPLCGGLGGSATDAASVLMGLNTLLDLRISPPDLNRIAASIGHDLPFFCSGFSHAFGHERTEQGVILESLPPLSGKIVLVAPPIEILAKAAYMGLKNRENELLQSPKNSSSFIKTPLFSYFRNELEYSCATCTRHPILTQIKSQLTESGAACTCLSGSGSTVFGVFQTQAEIDTILPPLKNRFNNCRIEKTFF